MQLVRRDDITLDRRGLRWLTLVATQQAWRLAATEHETPVGAFLADPDDAGELREPGGPASDPLERVIARELHRDRVAAFAAREPRELLLKAAGYRYHEIELSGVIGCHRRLPCGAVR